MFVSREGCDHICGECLERPPRFDSARAAGVYDGTLRKAIQMYKYQGGVLLARALGRLLAEHGLRFLGDRGVDLIVPVPLHAARLRQRGYNQALELARHVAACLGTDVAPEWLRKERETQQQVTLTRRQRRGNVRGAYAWAGPALDGSRVVLVDDVYTSGATADECSGVLKKSGAVRVDVLTVARTQ